MACILLYRGSVAASVALHRQLLVNVLHSSLSFFDTTPVGRVLNRFAKDVDVIDNALAGKLSAWLGCTMKVVSSISVLSFVTPQILATIVPLVVLYAFIQVLAL